MKILYVFPHPDDESFGPARAISAQIRAGHEVNLLTLTKGGATKERHKLGYSIDQMGNVRFQEMQQVAQVLGLSDLTVLDFPDSGLKELDPRVLETAIADHLACVVPDITVTYPVHGISGFHDHLITHAIVKRVYMQMRDEPGSTLKRLAFFTLTPEQAEVGSGQHSLSSSTIEEVDCLMTVEEEDMAVLRQALDCYVTYRGMIEKTGIKESMNRVVAFEFFQESFDPPVAAIDSGL
ncbi:PIG-L family deacetylase [Candidatus Bipolaricaulota bacterium]